MLLSNVFRLGVKELLSLWRDPMMLGLIVYAFSLDVVTATTAVPDTLQKATIAIVDEDQSEFSNRITEAFYPPYFITPSPVTILAADRGMDRGRYTFALDVPPNFQRDLLAGRTPALQLNVDATRISQAFVGAGYVQQIVQGQAAEFLQHYRGRGDPLPVSLEMRARFNPSLSQKWFMSVMQVVNNITTLSVILTGAALIREREHGTIEHLLVMPVTPIEIMASKVWSMGLVVLAASFFALTVVVQGWLRVPLAGSMPLFLAGTGLFLATTTSMGILMATVARSMPQFGLLLMLTIIPLQMLSGSVTPLESMPRFIIVIMQAAPTTHFVKIAKAVLYRDAGFQAVWLEFVWLTVIGVIFLVIALARFRRTISAMA